MLFRVLFAIVSSVFLVFMLWSLVYCLCCYCYVLLRGGGETRTADNRYRWYLGDRVFWESSVPREMHGLAGRERQPQSGILGVANGQLAS